MNLIRILVKEGLTGLYYVKNGADSRKSSLINPYLAKYGFNYNFVRKFIFTSLF